MLWRLTLLQPPPSDDLVRAPQPALCSQRTVVPSPAYRNGSSSLSHARPSSRSSSWPRMVGSPLLTEMAARRRSSLTTESPLAEVQVWWIPRLGVCGPARTVAAGAGLLGDLVTKVVPAAQRAGHPATGAGLAHPRQLAAHQRWAQGLADPLKGDPLPEHGLECPGDVWAQRRRGGVNEHHPARHDTWH